MKRFVIVLWLLVPVAVAAYHFGPGQRQMELDVAGALMQEAEELAGSGTWDAAVETYSEAISALPEGEKRTARQLRLARAKAQMLASQLPTAHMDLKGLLDEVQGDEEASPELVRETRSSLANAQYYVTWLMRLEGQPKDVWEPEIEASRQHYRVLAENAAAAGDTGAAKGYREDLEGSVRLARMELGELQGLPLPSQ
ncbi:MAG: hypothetical protein P8J87_10440 [Verrucomicrobiales bacterium]|nr:hypothetical protein [Verrucomicrobiales bacterium]